MGHSKLLDHSLPTNESVDEVVKNDIVRYKRKGNLIRSKTILLNLSFT